MAAGRAGPSLCMSASLAHELTSQVLHARYITDGITEETMSHVRDEAARDNLGSVFPSVTTGHSSSPIKQWEGEDDEDEEEEVATQQALGSWLLPSLMTLIRDCWRHSFPVFASDARPQAWF